MNYDRFYMNYDRFYMNYDRFLTSHMPHSLCRQDPKCA